MKAIISLITTILTISGMTAQINIPAIDVHSHVVTDEYLKYLDESRKIIRSVNERMHLRPAYEGIR